MYAEIYDCRSIPPLFAPPQFFVDGEPSSFEFDFLAATASSAFATDDKIIGIPEIFGIFDLNTMETAMIKDGQKPTLRSDLLGRPLPFNVHGKIQAQGFSMRLYQRMTDLVTLGANLIFFRSNSRQSFMLNTEEVKNITSGDFIDIEQARRAAFEEVGLIKNEISQHGLSDIDLYLRFGSTWDFIAKCRKIWAGLSLGVLFPTCVKTTLSSAASITFGGNGHWGLYAKADAVFEVQEDKKIGMIFEAIARMPKTVTTRLPAQESEPYIFSPIIGKARIIPAATVAFAPYFILENVRGGLGLGVNYTLISHGKDKWHDKRENKTVPVNLEGAMKTSKWGADYFTIDIFYDFKKVGARKRIEPVISFKWDIPAMLFVSHLVPKMHKISLGVMLAY